MNKVILDGRIVRDPEVRYTAGEKATCIARFTLASTRTFKNADGNYDSDFITCVAMGKNGEFIEKYFKKGSGIVVEGNIRTGNYTNKDGVKVYTTEVYVDSIGFPVTSKADGQEKTSTGKKQAASSAPKRTEKAPKSNNEFMNIPEDAEDDGLPFD